MQGFDGIFTKRGCADAPATPSTEAFDDVFVRRGRWRKDACEKQAESTADLTPQAPLQSEYDTTAPALNQAVFTVKNTFIDGTSIDYDSLRDFLQERQINSCPAAVFIDDIYDEVLNTASSFGDLHQSLVVSKAPEEFDNGSTPSVSADSASISNDSQSFTDEAVWNTASTSQDSDLDSSSQRLLELGTTVNLDTRFMPQLLLEDSLSQQTTGQFMVSVQTKEGVVPGIVTLLGNSEAASIAPNMPPASAPVLSLSDTIAPPQLGTEELPSIGSMMHHTGDCKPCTFFHTRGCENGDNCKFCHLCGPREKKKRLKVQKAAQREADFVALENAKVMLSTLRSAQGYGYSGDMIVE